VGAVANAFNIAWRDYNTDGVPASGPFKPIKSVLRGLGPIIEAYGSRWTIANTAADGVTDDTLVIQQTIDANKGGMILIPANSTFAGVLLSGSSYNDTTIVCQGEVNLLPNGSVTKYGIFLQACANVTVYLDMNGNRTSMVQDEHIQCVAIAGCTNCAVVGKVREIRGDGVYISRNGATQNLDITVDIRGYNSSSDGRNLVSVISCQGLKIRAWSWDIGGNVNSVNEPGGVDLETNATGDSIHDFDVEVFAYSSAHATNLLGVLGLEVTGGQRDYNIYNGRVKATLRSYASAPNMGNFARCRGVTWDLDIAGYGSPADGMEMDSCDNCSGHLKARNTIHALIVGFADIINTCNIDLDVIGCGGSSQQSVWLNSHAGCHFTGIIGEAMASSGPAVYFSNNGAGGVQDNTYEIVITSANNNLPSAYQQQGGHAITFTRCAVRGGSLSSFIASAGLANAFNGTFTGLNRIGVHGLNQLASIPTLGSWTQGDYVANTAPVLATGKVTTGWSRLTTGTGNVLNTDWAPQVVPNS